MAADGAKLEATAINLDLPVLNRSRQATMTERLTAVPVATGQLRLSHSPGLVEGLVAGDIIELDDEEEQGFRVVRHAPWICVWYYFAKKEDLYGPGFIAAKTALEAIGGQLDGGTHRSLIFNVPLQTGFSTIESTMERLVARFPDTEWIYGNVYGLDGTPLNWWT
jgi:hypothetical protein